MKRVIESLAVIVTAPLWVPIAALVAVAILAFNGSPVLFRQERAGKGGRVFTMLKFRTMRGGEGTDAERLTRLGRFLRATSLDELPQLLHVLSGRMALVGPRPLPARYLPRYSPEQARRHEVRPGITGWAQVNGNRGETKTVDDMRDRVEKDIWYIEHWSPELDLRIFLKTIMQLLHADKQAF